MKIKFTLLFLLIVTYSSEGFSRGNGTKQEEKKATKSKYDFNVFKLVSIDNKPHQADSTKTKPITTTPSSSKETE